MAILGLTRPEIKPTVFCTLGECARPEIKPTVFCTLGECARPEIKPTVFCTLGECAILWQGSIENLTQLRIW